MLRKFLDMLFYIKRKDRLDSIPRTIADQYDRRVSPDVAKVFAQTQARSPKHVALLMKRHKVNTVEELLDVLPSRQRKANPRERLHRWLMRLQGLLPYDPLPSAVRRLESDRSLIRRTKAPDYAPP